jgi:bacterioferritin-associated ferredoxin
VYICLCHGFTDKQVKGAIAQGRRSMSEIYACLGGKPRCGRCVGEVRALMTATPVAAEPAGGVPRALQAPPVD